MQYRPLGRTGINVSALCLGSMTWGTQNSEAEGHQQIDHAVDAGINFIDAAEMYPTTPTSPETQGRTEEIIGTWFKASGRRADVVMATKITGGGNEWVRGGEAISSAAIRTSGAILTCATPTPPPWCAWANPCNAPWRLSPGGAA